MPEELREDSLGFTARNDPATLAAWGESIHLVDRVVEDVNGRRLGRVLKCFAEEGALVRCDIKVDNNAKGLFDVQQDVAGIPTQWIAAVNDETVRLNKAGEQVFHPDDPRSLGASADARGAKELPRKVR